MKLDTINRIVYYIPIRKLRDAVREYLIMLIDLDEEIWDLSTIIEFRKSFKKDNDFISRYKRLINGLDDKSIDIVYDIVFCITNFNNINDKIFFHKDELENLNTIRNNFYKKISKVNDECFIYKKYLLSRFSVGINVLYERHGIENVHDMNKIFSKNIIDAGAFLGDSAVFFSEYTNNKVYSFEAFKSNYNLLLKTIELNDIKNVVPINMALGNENKEFSIFYDGNHSGMLSIETEKQSDLIEEKTMMITLDKFVEDNNIEVGLIKTDLEGFEQKFLEGAINTIKKQKPILMI
ncbi:FkbM family methyltransferase, partial [uncultured Brachyspira sp.]|uniref:FkbM family methyltransferase n=1 Tax=uncultured Brachyspira sp. TaxID=221953 RepID=UPI00262113BE